MSAKAREPASDELVDRVTARLLARSREGKRADPRPRYSRLHEAAAVLGWFDPRTIRASGGPVDADPASVLLPDSEPCVDADGLMRLALSTEVRVRALRQIRTEGRLREAFAANPPNAADPLRDGLEAYVAGTATPVEEQTLPQLSVTSQVCEWLSSAGFEGLPSRDTILRRVDWLTLLQPFEHLAGPSFRGRTRELERLRSYAGVLPPGSKAESARRLFQRVFSLRDKPPLLIYGPGGVGKSTLLARFILEHARALEVERFPFVYLDFDRPEIDASLPLTLLMEAVRQLGIEYVEIGRSGGRISAAWLDLLNRGESSRRTCAAAARDVGTLVGSVGGPDTPVLFVLDTFEEVQYRSAEQVQGIWHLLEDLQDALPRLRVCIVGRAQLPPYRVDELELSGLDEGAAIGYLQEHGIADARVARRIVRAVGGSPLSLKLVADLAERDGLDDGTLGIDELESLFVRVDDATIQRQLYRRILDHIHDKDVRKLAHPGLVLRSITPELILEVLAKPCDLTIDSAAEAQKLFDELRREVSLVRLGSDGSLVHRADIRRIMLQLLEVDQAHKTRVIRERAVAYYEARPEKVRERAEEIYLRLTLHHDPDDIDLRWLSGVERFLASALPEFSGARRAYLAARLGVEVDEETRRLADIEDWERFTARKVGDLLAAEEPEQALGLLESRRERTALSPLFGLQASVLTQLERWPEAMLSLEQGILGAITRGARRQALELTLQQAEIVLATPDAENAERVVTRLAQLTNGTASNRDRLAAASHRLAIQRLMPPSSSTDTDELRQEVRRLFDATPDEVMQGDPRLARRVASLFGSEDGSRLSRVLCVTGWPQADSGSIRGLAAAIAGFDRQISPPLDEPPGAIGRQLGVPMGDSLTASWGAFLLSEDGSRVAETMSRLLDTHASFVSPELMDAFGELMESTLSLRRRAVPEPAAAPLRARGRPSLTRDMRERLARELADLYSHPDTLRRFLRFRLDLSLEAITPGGSNLAEMIFAVVAFAESQGIVEQLVIAATEANPGSVALAQVRRSLGVSTIVPSDPAPLERIIEEAMPFDVSRWSSQLGSIATQVCRVAVGAGPRGSRTDFGTGFLVGADLVLTADHLLGDRAPGDVQVTFDYKTDRNGHSVGSGTVFQTMEFVSRRPYGAGANQPGYALLRVDGSPGTRPVGSGRADDEGSLRGWIEVPDRPPRLATGAGIVVVHHARGGPLKLALGAKAVRGLSPDGTRVFYDLSTEAGSSGSPCFTTDLTPVACHIGTGIDGNAPRNAGVGILLSAVVEDARRNGRGDLFGTVLA